MPLVRRAKLCFRSGCSSKGIRGAGQGRRNANRDEWPAPTARHFRLSGKLLQNGLGKKLVDLPMPRNWLCHACSRILVPIVFPAMSDQIASHLLDLLDEVPGASRHLQLGHLSNRWNMPARQLRVQIAQMLLKILQRFALGYVIWILLKVAQPELVILPVNIPKTFHGMKLQPQTRLGNDIVLAERPRGVIRSPGGFSARRAIHPFKVRLTASHHHLVEIFRKINHSRPINKQATTKNKSE
jgi:hypothetical protein